MIRITLDGRPVELEPGQSILDGARKLGMDIPTLCYLERCGPMSSCLVCVVRLKFNGRSSIVPSCAMKAVDGMVVESETAEVHELRRSALELLLSDHVGDCLSPCARICPLGLNVPQMLRQVQMERPEEAIGTVRNALALPAVLGRLCHRPCENGCRRLACDSAAAIRDVELYVADTNQRQEQPFLPPKRPATGKRVAVVGSGPAGLAAAYELTRLGHSAVVFDRQPRPGGTLWRAVADGTLPEVVVQRELEDLRQFGIEFRTGVEVGVGAESGLDALLRTHDAVLLTVGEVTREEGARLGVELTGAGVKIVKADAFLTSVPGVFAAGSAIRPVKQLVKAMAEGQAAAEAIAEFLAGHDPRKAAKPFSSIMGRLERIELGVFQQGASPEPRHPVPTGAVYDPAAAAAESARCLHCDCRAEGNCRLQHYSQVYGAEFGRFPRQRRAFEQQQHPGRVLFESGKCILCGICIKIASEAAEPLGLTFIGRGFEVRVGAPLNEAFERGLQKVAVECADACPTGAIVVAAPTDAHWADTLLPSGAGAESDSPTPQDNAVAGNGNGHAQGPGHSHGHGHGHGHGHCGRCGHHGPSA